MRRGVLTIVLDARGEDGVGGIDSKGFRQTFRPARLSPAIIEKVWTYGCGEVKG